MKRFNLFLSLLLVTQLTSASTNTSLKKARITELYTTGTYHSGNAKYVGDVTFKTSTMPASCHWFWLSASDVKANPSMMSVALSSLHAGSDLYVAAYTDEQWGGSKTEAYCRVHTIGITK